MQADTGQAECYHRSRVRVCDTFILVSMEPGQSEKKGTLLNRACTVMLKINNRGRTAYP